MMKCMHDRQRLVNYSTIETNLHGRKVLSHNTIHFSLDVDSHLVSFHQSNDIFRLDSLSNCDGPFHDGSLSLRRRKL